MEIVVFDNKMLKQLTDFYIKCFSALNISYSPDSRHSDIADIEKNYMQNGVFRCLMDNEEFIGTAALRRIDKYPDSYELKSFFVLPGYQNKGFGKMLLDHAISYAKENGYKSIYLDTRKDFEKAQHIYKSFGFTEIPKYNDNKADLFFKLDL